MIFATQSEWRVTCRAVAGRAVIVTAVLIGSAATGTAVAAADPSPSTVPSGSILPSASILPAASHSIETVAGDGMAQSDGDGRLAINAGLDYPTGIAEDLTGTLYIADTAGNRVRRVIRPTMLGQDFISTFAGTGQRGYGGNGGPATSAKLHGPTGVAVDSAGDVFIADTGNNRVREVLPSGVIKTFAGTGACRRFADNGDLATGASLCGPTGVAVDGTSVYISDTGHNEVRVVKADGRISDFAGTGMAGDSGGGGRATRAALDQPTGLAVNAIHDVFIADTANHRVLEVVPSGSIHLFAGGRDADGNGRRGHPDRPELQSPTGLAADQDGNVYIADTVDNRLWEADPNGNVKPFAGTGRAGFLGDGGPAAKARLTGPTGVVVDSTAVYFSDTGNERVRGVFLGPPPVLPEAPLVALFPVGGLLIAGGAIVVARRRHRASVPGSR